MLRKIVHQVGFIYKKKTHNFHEARTVFTILYITPRSTAFLKKPKVFQSFNNFTEFRGTRKFITLFARARHFSSPTAR